MQFARVAQAFAVVAISLGVSAALGAASEPGPLRDAAKSAVTHLEELQSQQLKLRTELNQVAKRIEALKARRAPSLVSSQKLQTELKRSQKLSGELSDLAKELSAAQAEAQRKNQSLMSALSDALSDVQRQWAEARDLARRQQLVDQMRSLRAERDQLRALLSAGDPPAISERTSGSPEDLLEQADALRDSGDKVQQQIKELRARISDLRAERELDMRMADFARDEALFDEHDRRVRSRGQDSRALYGPQPTGPQTTPQRGPAGAGTDPQGGSRSSGPGAGDRSAGNPAEATPRTDGVSDGRAPAVIAPTRFESSDNLSVLEQKLKQLEILAKQLEERARQSEIRARALQQ